MDTATTDIRCWRISEWPAEDRRLWINSCAEDDPFEGPFYAADLRQATRDKTSKGYGRWLCFLASRGWLDPELPPLDRVTKRRLRQYFGELRLAGNADYTIIGRFDELARAMRILAPNQDSSWITKPRGLAKRKRALLVPHIGVLLEWGFSVMDNAWHQPAEQKDLISFRDGLLLAMLASCGRRLRSISLIRIGQEITRRGECYRIELSAAQVKTKRPDMFDLSPSLTPYIDHYVDSVRPALLADAALTEFWISARGRHWTSKALQSQVLALSQKKFGKAFGPHRFRHSIATTLPQLEPSNPTLAAELLGISSQTVQDSYNRASQTRAALSYQALLDQRIVELQS